MRCCRALDRYAAGNVNSVLVVSRGIAVLAARSAARDTGNQPRDSAGIPRRRAPWLVVLLLAWSAPALADEPPALAKARALYNAGSYEAAIQSAAMVRGDQEFGDEAALVIARAHLERYRTDAEKRDGPFVAPQEQVEVLADLASARDALTGIRSAGLSPRDQIDLLIGLGQALYFGNQFGAAARLFATALERASLLPARDRDLLLDWWATALDRAAQSRPAEHRTALFVEIGERMEQELAAEPGSAVANYWLVAAARGRGDVDRAWDAAIAAWVSAALAPETTKTLRADLDRLVNEALIPERARTRPAREDPAVALRVEWERMKEQWK